MKTYDDETLLEPAVDAVMVEGLEEFDVLRRLQTSVGLGDLLAISDFQIFVCWQDEGCSAICAENVKCKLLSGRTGDGIEGMLDWFFSDVGDLLLNLIIGKGTVQDVSCTKF